jgi:hypothetical protein
VLTGLLIPTFHQPRATAHMQRRPILGGLINEYAQAA